MIEPLVFWLAMLAAFSAGLAYYRYVEQPARLEARLSGAVRAFGRAVELRFPNHAGLTDVIVRLARKVGLKLGLGPRRLRELELSIRLRDIGLCAIPYRLVNRRQWDEWSPSEAATYDCHSEVGGAILETIPALAQFSETVRNHHASFEPAGDMPFSRVPPVDARIVKACAEYVWYSRYLGREAAVERLEQGAGTVYDPQIAREVLRLIQTEDAAR